MAIRSTHALLAAMLFASGAAVAQAAEPAPVIRLSPEEIARIQAEAEARPPSAPATRERERRRLSGEFGASIGTGGWRDIYGAINTPLGEDGQALISGGAERALPQRPVRRNLDRR